MTFEVRLIAYEPENGGNKELKSPCQAKIQLSYERNETKILSGRDKLSTK